MYWKVSNFLTYQTQTINFYIPYCSKTSKYCKRILDQLCAQSWNKSILEKVYCSETQELLYLISLLRNSRQKRKSGHFPYIILRNKTAALHFSAYLNNASKYRFSLLLFPSIVYPRSFQIALCFTFFLFCNFIHLPRTTGYIWWCY